MRIGRFFETYCLVTVAAAIFAPGAHPSTPDLAADLAAARKRRRMHVHVSDACSHGGDDLGELAGSELLGSSCAANDISGRDGAVNGAGAGRTCIHGRRAA